MTFILEYLRDALGRWLLRKPTQEAERYAMWRDMHTEQAAIRQEMATQFREDIEKERAAQRELMTQTLDVMAELVNSVKSQQDTLTSYLGIFTGAGKPQIRTMSDADLAVREAEVVKDQPITKRKEVLPPDPFKWMGDRPDLFDPASPEQLSSIKDSLAF